MPRRQNGSNNSSIPKELLRLRTNQIYAQKKRRGENTNIANCWKQARQELRGKWWRIKFWQFKTTNRKILTFPSWLLFNKLPKLFADKESREFALDIVKTIFSLASLIAALVAAVGLWFNYQEANKDRQLVLERLDNDRERLVTERFTKAIAQLGSTEEEVILGGIYSLERIAQDSPKDQWTSQGAGEYRDICRAGNPDCLCPADPHQRAKTEIR